MTFNWKKNYHLAQEILIYTSAECLFAFPHLIVTGKKTGKT